MAITVLSIKAQFDPVYNKYCLQNTEKYCLYKIDLYSFHLSISYSTNSSCNYLAGKINKPGVYCGTKICTIIVSEDNSDVMHLQPDYS